MPAIETTIAVRPAIKEDCARIMELVHELAVYEKAPEEVTVTLEHFINSGFGDNPIWWAFVAEAENNIVGFALYYVRYSTWKGQRMYLEDILITESWRNKGVGTMLMHRLIEEARLKNYHGITWQVLDWNEPAIEFYKQFDPKFDGEWINVSIDL